MTKPQRKSGLPRGPQPDERGAALLSVLLLVAVMAVIAATALDRLTLATRLAGSAALVDQGRAYSHAAEEITLSRVAQLVRRDASRLTLAGGWLGQDFALPLPQGHGRARLEDASNCFNINSLVAEASPRRFTQRPGAVMQFAALMELLGVPKNEAQSVAAATADFLDSDTVEAPLGAEDSAYRSGGGGYLAANRLISDKSEWRAVRGVTPALYARMAPWICVLPVAQPVRLNANTLTEPQAVLVAMLMPGEMSLAKARAALAMRPADGYGSSERFWRSGPLADLNPRPDVAEQIAMNSRWLLLETEVEMGDSLIMSRSLIDAYGGALIAGDAAPQIISRKWGEWD
ncbi:MAG TPA: type II secretion system minor pseudopilin GspK [Sphingopyxis sp.]|nr:type II secretion system minor pseudopilin GspK [Sphingopyxis sp.]